MLKLVASLVVAGAFARRCDGRRGGGLQRGREPGSCLGTDREGLQRSLRERRGGPAVGGERGRADGGGPGAEGALRARPLALDGRSRPHAGEVGAAAGKGTVHEVRFPNRDGVSLHATRSGCRPASRARRPAIVVRAGRPLRRGHVLLVRPGDGRGRLRGHDIRDPRSGPVGPGHERAGRGTARRDPVLPRPPRTPRARRSTASGSGPPDTASVRSRSRTSATSAAS